MGIYPFALWHLLLTYLPLIEARFHSMTFEADRRLLLGFGLRQKALQKKYEEPINRSWEADRNRQGTRCVWAFVVPVTHSNSQQSCSLLFVLLMFKVILGKNKHLPLQCQQLIKCDGILLRMQQARLLCFSVRNTFTEMKTAVLHMFRNTVALIFSSFGRFWCSGLFRGGLFLLY